MKKIKNNNYISVESKNFLDDKGNNIPYNAYYLNIYCAVKKDFVQVKLKVDKGDIALLESLNQIEYEEM